MDPISYFSSPTSYCHVHFSPSWDGTRGGRGYATNWLTTRKWNCVERAKGKPPAKAFPPCTILWGKKKIPLNPYSFVLLRFSSPAVSSLHPFHVLFSPLLDASPFSLPHASRRSVVQINKHKRLAGERGRGIETPCNSHGGEVRNKMKGWVSHGRYLASRCNRSHELIQHSSPAS